MVQFPDPEFTESVSPEIWHGPFSLRVTGAPERVLAWKEKLDPLPKLKVPPFDQFPQPGCTRVMTSIAVGAPTVTTSVVEPDPPLFVV
jgi:hypothetical protein